MRSFSECFAIANRACSIIAILMMQLSVLMVAVAVVLFVALLVIDCAEIPFYNDG